MHRKEDDLLSGSALMHSLPSVLRWDPPSFPHNWEASLNHQRPFMAPSGALCFVFNRGSQTETPFFFKLLRDRFAPRLRVEQPCFRLRLGRYNEESCSVRHPRLRRGHIHPCVCGGMQTGAAVSGFAPVEEQTKGQFSLSGLGGDADTGDDATRGLFPLPAHLQYNSLDP